MTLAELRALERNIEEAPMIDRFDALRAVRELIALREVAETHGDLHDMLVGLGLL